MRRWGVAASFAIAVAAVVRGVVLVLSALTFDTVGRSVGGAEGIERIQTAIVGVLLATALVVVAGVVVLGWLFVARTNADHVPGPSPRWARAWSIGAWFVPLGNLVLVPLVVADVWRSSGPDRRGPTEVALWWTSVLVAAALNVAATSYRAGGGATTATGLQILGAVMEVVAGGLLVLVVHRISTRQNQSPSIMPAVR
ncbi:DUF4328 domain-containing protein [Actinomycetospora sp. C-140]